MKFFRDKKANKTGNIDQIKKYIERNPNDEQGYFNLGISLHSKKQYNEAIAAYRKAIKLEPKNHDTYYNLGSALYEINDFDGAIKEFENAIEIDLNYEPAYYFISTILLEGGNLDAVKKLHDKIYTKFKADVRPIHADNHYKLGKIFYLQGNFEGGLKEFERAFKIDEYFFECCFYIGVILKDQNKKEDAIEYLKKFINSSPNTKSFKELKKEAKYLLKDLNV
jgi:tetratricopeptide (TPR) repeat protein